MSLLNRFFFLELRCVYPFDLIMLVGFAAVGVLKDRVCFISRNIVGRVCLALAMAYRRFKRSNCDDLLEKFSF